jgi:hypothetical protein
VVLAGAQDQIRVAPLEPQGQMVKDLLVVEILTTLQTIIVIPEAVAVQVALAQLWVI